MAAGRKGTGRMRRKGGRDTARVRPPGSVRSLVTGIGNVIKVIRTGFQGVGKLMRILWAVGQRAGKLVVNIWNGARRVGQVMKSVWSGAQKVGAVMQAYQRMVQDSGNLTADPGGDSPRPRSADSAPGPE